MLATLTKNCLLNEYLMEFLVDRDALLEKYSLKLFLSCIDGATKQKLYSNFRLTSHRQKIKSC